MYCHRDERDNALSIWIENFNPDQRQQFLSLPEEERFALHEHLLTLDLEEQLVYAIRWAQERIFLSEKESEVTMKMVKFNFAYDRDVVRMLSKYQQ